MFVLASTFVGRGMTRRCRWNLSVADPFVCLGSTTMRLFPHRRAGTGRTGLRMIPTFPLLPLNWRGLRRVQFATHRLSSYWAKRQRRLDTDAACTLQHSLGVIGPSPISVPPSTLLI